MLNVIDHLAEGFVWTFEKVTSLVCIVVCLALWVVPICFLAAVILGLFK